MTKGTVQESSMTAIIPGKTKFRATYADSFALWRVEASRGDNVWDCVVDGSDRNYGGIRQVFGGEQIEAALDMDKTLSGLRVASEEFWATCELGEILHYQDGNARWVRGVVVEGRDNQNKVGKVLLPTHLIGDWRPWDMPSWSASGVYNAGCYQAKKIAEGATFQPNAHNIWEYRYVTGQRVEGDPRQMDALDLTPPAPTPQQMEAARLLKQIDEIRDAISTSDWSAVTDFVAHYRAQLEKVASLVEDFEIEPSNSSLKR
jgi:hypothetical protein